MPRNPVGAVQSDIILGARSRRFEDIVNDRAHGKDGRPCIDHCTADRKLADFAAGAILLFNDGDGHSA